MKRAPNPRHSIRRKLLRLVILAVSASVLLFASLQVWLEANRYLVAKRSIMEATAAAFASASAPAVAQHSTRAVTAALRGIGSLREVEFVAVRDAHGTVLASLGSGVRLSGDLDLDPRADVTPWRLLMTRTVSFTTAIHDAGQVIGTLSLVEDVSDLWTRLRNLVLLNLAVGAAALVLAGVIVSRLQSAITRPLLALTRAIERMGADGIYTRVEGIEAQDEVGVLANRFNVMVDAVRDRDRRLVEHRDNLEREVAERTRDLALAKDEAVTANCAKSTFLATMSHEIRTPMTGLLVMAELLASDDLPAGARRYADVICRSGTALLAIINDILDFSKIEAGKLEVERIRVDIRDVVQTVINLFYARALEKGLDLAAAIAPDMPAAIEGDPVRLQQIVSNLVNNALKFTATGHVLVTAHYADGHLTLSVKDTGIGISDAQRARIFEAFAQADGSTTRQFGGTGLGLAISNRLALAMGGAITVESEPGLGSDFRLRVAAPALAPPNAVLDLPALSWAVDVRRPATGRVLRQMLEQLGLPECDGGTPDITFSDDEAFSDGGASDRGGRLVRLVAPGAGGGGGAALKLPLALEDVARLVRALADGTDSVGPGDAHATTLPSFAGARILVADDTAVNREVMTEALKRFALVPDLVTNGREAVQAAAAARYDLIFMDASMPELDGFAATRLIRASEGPCRSAPIFALTAHVVGAAAEAWREAGMDGVLFKPFTLADLQRTLQSVLKETAPGQTASEPKTREETADALLDRSVLADILSMSSQTGSDFAGRVFRLFLREAPAAFETLRTAAQSGSPDTAGRAAHALKSMSYNIGAKRVAAHALRVERAARDGGVAADLVAELEAALLATYDAIAAEPGVVMSDVVISSVAMSGEQDVTEPRQAAAAE